MSEQPTGKLAWGQAAAYDAIDDRSVIAAVTRNRTGLVWPPTVRAGTGMNIILEAGWLGVASCGDHTSAVAGSRLDQVIPANPGPATGSRDDWLWCDTEPDSGVWSLVVIPRSAAVGRFGMPLAYITVPANATSASQLTIVPVSAELERRLLGYDERNDTRTASGQTWETADTITWTACTVGAGPVVPGPVHRHQPGGDDRFARGPHRHRAAADRGHRGVQRAPAGVGGLLPPARPAEGRFSGAHVPPPEDIGAGRLHLYRADLVGGRRVIPGEPQHEPRPRP